MIELFYWPTPNGHKLTLFLEEVAIPYKITPVNIGAGEQFKPEFLRISPNNRIPAIVDHAPTQGQRALPLFESGAILLYLAEKTGRFLPTELHKRAEVLQWLFWQVGGLGPMAGQANHFANYAPEQIPYAIARYRNETSRLFGVLNKNLRNREFVCGPAYTIADMAIYPWIVPHEGLGLSLGDFPDLQRWFKGVAARPATTKAYEIGARINPNPPKMDEKTRAVLFGQSAQTVKPN